MGPLRICCKLNIEEYSIVQWQYCSITVRRKMCESEGAQAMLLLSQDVGCVLSPQ